MLRGIASGMRYLSDMGYVHRVGPRFNSFSLFDQHFLIVDICSRSVYLFVTITSAKESVLYPACVRSFVCLFVCLLAISH